MDLISATLGLPFAPLRAVLALAQILQDEAEQQLYSPTQVRREIEEIELAREKGELSDDDAEQAEQQAIDRLLPG